MHRRPSQAQLLSATIWREVGPWRWTEALACSHDAALSLETFEDVLTLDAWHTKAIYSVTALGWMRSGSNPGKPFDFRTTNTRLETPHRERKDSMV